MKKILIVLVMISFLFTSHIYGEVDGWKDYKFGMSIEEVDGIMKNKCKGNYEVSPDQIKSKTGEPCFSIAGFQPNKESFIFENNKLVSIELRLNFTNDKAIHEDFKSYNQIYHLIKENEYEIFKDKILKALKKKYGYMGKFKENDKTSYVAFGNGQIIAKTYTYAPEPTKFEYSFSLWYLPLNQAKEMLIELGIVKKTTEDDL